MSNKPLRLFQERFTKGDFASIAIGVQIEAGWYDWFCRNDELAAKTARMGKVINRLQNSDKVNLDTMYVFFKNNCPCVGPLYDDFRICDLEEGNVLFNVAKNSPHEDEKWLWTVTDFRMGNAEVSHFDSDKELLAWFNS